MPWSRPPSKTPPATLKRGVSRLPSANLALLLTAVPEGGTLIPHLENQVFLLSSYPDGTPATAALTVHIPGEHDQHVTTDSSGIATIHLVPGELARRFAWMLMIIGAPA